MDLELDLLENSYDYLNNALAYYNKSNLDNGHELGQAYLETKIMWKTGFVMLVQSLELLLKEVLRKNNEILVYENIDVPINANSKTISFQKAIQRIINLREEVILSGQSDFITKCCELRNQFTHYKVEFNSIDIKIKFCKLIEIYTIIHKKIMRKKIMLC